MKTQKDLARIRKSQQRNRRCKEEPNRNFRMGKQKTNKNSVHGLSIKVYRTEERISELEDRAIEMI